MLKDGVEKSCKNFANLVIFIKPETKWANYDQADNFKKIKILKAELVYVAKC